MVIAECKDMNNILKRLSISSSCYIEIWLIKVKLKIFIFDYATIPTFW